MSDFMGKNGFQWFVGVVEDRKDPQTLGRLRVRCLGYHSEGLDKLPTKDLPWAHVMNPITSATVSGIGQSPLGAVEGTWVVGFFQDGSDAQQPIIIGTLPGKPTEVPDTTSKKGFMDTSGNYPKYKDESDVNRLSVNDKDLPHSSLTIRKADLDKKVGTAQIDGIFNGVALIPEDLDLGAERVISPHSDATIRGGEWDEPETAYATEYPHNHVYESEAGHIREIDDTPNAERIHERHISGTGYELHPEGDKVTRVKKDNYDLIYGQQFTHIRGTQSTTVNGGVKVFVNASAAGAPGPPGQEVQKFHYTIEVGANANVNIQVNKGDVNVVASDGTINMKAGKDINIEAAQAIRLKSRTFDAEMSSEWNETTGNKTENTGHHQMNSTTTTIDSPGNINLN